MALSKTLGAFLGRERLARAGVAAIELALVAPILALGVLGAGELGITILRQTQVRFAAQAGVDYARTNGFNASGITNAIVNSTNYAAITATPAPSQFCGCASATGVLPAQCGSPCSSGYTAGHYVTASAQAQFHPVIPNQWQTNTVTLATQATVRIQ
ncbi:MAG: TadE/TadG family type IV pilus assembly protein [Methylocella sp.]